MTTKTHCDRCGEIIPGHAADTHLIRGNLRDIYMRSNTISYVEPIHEPKQFDVCRVCMADFERFMEWKKGV